MHTQTHEATATRGAPPETTREALATRRALECCHTLVGSERSYLFDKGHEFFMPLPVHHQPPALRLVARMRAEADTPGHRRAYAKRQELIENRLHGFEQIKADTTEGQFSRLPRQGARVV